VEILAWNEGTGKYFSSSPPFRGIVMGKCTCTTDTQEKDQGQQQHILKLVNYLGLLFFFLRSLPAKPVYVS